MFQGKARTPIEFDTGSQDPAQLLVMRLKEQGEIPLKERVKLNSTCQIIEGLEVYFPYKPYDVQIEYMKKVILTLKKEKQNALLQSPTGTGKTLSLLCSALAWLRKSRQDAYKQIHDANISETPPFIKIIYASRTHSQLKQVAKELKRTVYEPKICILGSRDQLCIKTEFRTMRGNQLNQACQKAIAGSSKKQFQSPNATDSSCQYFSKDQLMHLAGRDNREVMDIEELKAYGTKHKACPYYFERMRKESADIILMPYNYLLEHQFSSIVDVENSILIFDEAHNVPGVAEEGSSFSLSTTQLDDAEKELNRWIEILVTDSSVLHKINKSDEGDDISIEVMRGIQQTMKCFLQFLASLVNSTQFQRSNEGMDNPGTMSFVVDAGEIFNWLFTYTQDKSGFFQTTLTQKQNVNSKRLQFHQGISPENIDSYINIGQKFTLAIQELVPGYHFENWLRFVKQVGDLRPKTTEAKVTTSWIDIPLNHYKLCVQKDENDVVSLNLWCLDPGQAFQRLLNRGVYSIILTSGTLTPFSSWASELRMDFVHQLNNGHVIDIQNSLVAGIVCKGANGIDLDFGFNNRQNGDIYDDLGMLLMNMCNHIPNGVLVVFSSYGLMNKCKWEWAKKTKQILKRLEMVKSLYWEPNSAAELQDQFNQFSKAALTPRGAIMFGVCRGKVAEGIDFSDELCRAVFVVGIPYPPYKDTKVELKRGHIDRICRDSNVKGFQKINSQEWYRQQAIRATNQAIGRVIRHKEDYGGIYLCDRRFEGQSVKQDVSSWVLPTLQIWRTFSDTMKASSEFFSKKKSLPPVLKLQIENEENERNHLNQARKRGGMQFFGLNAKKLLEAHKTLDTMFQQRKQVEEDSM